MSDESGQPEGSPEPESELCPSCGEPIPADAPQGLCPKCVLEVVASPTDEGTPTTAQPRFEPPSLETVRAAFPQFEILDLIGCGGMGAVFRARQPHLDRQVALKILPRELGDLPEFAERFARESQVLAKLDHPNIVSVFDFGESEGFFFLLMEYVDGVNLRQAMRAGRFSPEQALEIVPPICEALQFAHDEGVLHRDIKPENVLLDAKGRVKIADFGIAKLLGEAVGPGPTLTRGAVPGTPQYMAPEQIEQPAQVDHRADIYSLGVVFYEMLTGELPIGRFAAPSERSGVGAEVDEIVFRSLEKEREKRQQSATQVRTEVAGVEAKAVAEGGGGETVSNELSPAISPRITGASTMEGEAGDAEIELNARQYVRPILARDITFGGLAALILIIATAHLTSKWIIYDDFVDYKIGITWLPNLHPGIFPSALLATLLGLGMLFTVPGTVYAWKQLKIQKMLMATEGRFSLLASAWFWPAVWVSSPQYIFSHFIPLFGGFIAGPVFLCSVLMAVTAAILFTAMWMNWPVEENIRMKYLKKYEIMANRSRESSIWGRFLLLWSGIGFAFSLPIPVVWFYKIIAGNAYSNGGEWINLAINFVSLSLLSIAYLFLVNRIYHLPAVAKQAGVRKSEQQLDPNGAADSRLKGSRWIVWVAGIIFGLHLLFLGAIAILSSLTLDPSGTPEISPDPPEITSTSSPKDLVGENSQGNDLSEDERNLVGTWQLQIPGINSPQTLQEFGMDADFGRFNFHADRTWGMDGQEVGAHWGVENDILALEGVADDDLDSVRIEFELGRLKPNEIEMRKPGEKQWQIFKKGDRKR